MNRVRMKDLALIAFAGGLLAFEAASLSSAWPALRGAVAGAAGLSAVSRGTAVAGQSVLNGVSAATSQAAAQVVRGAARRMGVAPAVARPVCPPVASSEWPARVQGPMVHGSGYVMVVGSDRAALRKARLELAACRRAACRARIHAVAQRNAAAVLRRTIEAATEAAAL